MNRTKEPVQIRRLGASALVSALLLALLAGCTDETAVTAQSGAEDASGTDDAALNQGDGSTDGDTATGGADGTGLGDGTGLEDGTTLQDGTALEDGAQLSDATDLADTAPGTDATAGGDASNACVNAAGQALNCDDSNACTTDSCDPQKGCQHVAIAGCKGGVCLNDDACTASGQVCDTAAHVCVDCTAQKGCAAGSVCEANKCVAATGCASDKDCKASNQVCNVATKVCVDCLSGVDCQAGLSCVANKCVSQQKCASSKDCPAVCDKGTGLCVDCLTDTDCKPGQYCGADKGCHADLCTASVCGTQGFFACAANGSGFAAPVLCDDGSLCTIDSCDTTTGCKFSPQPDGTVCGGDGAVCGALSQCQSGKCQVIQVAGCDDGNVCTADVCDPGKGCSHTPQTGAKCTANKDGSPCTSGTVACQASGLCAEPPTAGWLCCGGSFGGPCDADTAGWALSGDAATAEKIGDTKSADAGADFLAVGTAPTESGKDGSASHALAANGQTSGVLSFQLQVISEEFLSGCGANNGQSYQDSLTIQIDGKTVFTATVGDFCAKAVLAPTNGQIVNPPAGAKGTYPMGLYDAGKTPTGDTAQRTPWIVFHVPVSGLNSNAPLKVTVTAKSVGDQQNRTLYLVDGLKLEDPAAAGCSGGTCCQAASACDICSAGTTCATCLGNDCDGDGVATANDNCPILANADQKNADADALGDVCDPSNCIQMTCTGPLRQECANGKVVPGCCKSSADCGDANPCTTPYCQNGTCGQQTTQGCCQFNSQCADNDPCTLDTCSSSNKCQHTDIQGCN